MPFVIQMIRSGDDVDTIVRSVLGDEAQISIDALDEACSTFVPHCETRKLKRVSASSVN